MQNALILIMLLWLIFAPWILLIGSPPLLDYDLDEDYAIPYMLHRWLLGFAVILVAATVLRQWWVWLAFFGIFWYLLGG